MNPGVRAESQQIQAFYKAALSTLRYIEAASPTGRRFGSEADALWTSFKGDLTTADRVDLLIRDADAHWPSAFGPRTVFAKHSVSEDEPFGPDWVPLDAVDAEELWRAGKSEEAPASRLDALRSVAAAWDIELSEFEPPALNPSDKLILAGPSAIVATIEAFAGAGSDFDWADQVTVVASPAAHRQLAALSGALLGSSKPTTLLNSEAVAEAKPNPSARLILSNDANQADAEKARALISQ